MRTFFAALSRPKRVRAETRINGASGNVRGMGVRVCAVHGKAVLFAFKFPAGRQADSG